MATLNRYDLLVAMAAHVRGAGLAGASLRPLARAAGTSDRMLIYHFGSKDGLISELLAHLSDEMLGALTAALPGEPAASEAGCIQRIVQLLRTPTFRPYVRVWFDILSAAGGADAAHVEATRRILAGQLDWIAAHLPPDTPRPRQRAKQMLAVIQGVLVLEIAGMNKAADAAIGRFYPAG